MGFLGILGCRGYEINDYDKEKGREDEYGLYMRVTRLAPQVIAEKRRIYKGCLLYTSLRTQHHFQ